MINFNFEVADASKKDALKEKLKAYGTFCPIHDNCWAIVSDHTPVQIRDSLSSTLSETDSIFVMRSGTYSAWINSYGTKHDEWLKERL